jgi:hypothetical protein
LKGADAQRVKRLQKPLLVPWVVNQVYWHARPVYERLSQSGEKLRAAQVAALKGRNADIPAASRAHRQALTAAVEEGTRLASRAGARPASDQLARTFEALSLASEVSETPGRLTKPLNPAGFEALGGVAVRARGPAPARVEAPQVRKSASQQSRLALEARERQAVEERKREALEKAQAAAIRKAESEVAWATSAEAVARKKWEQAKRDLESAERALRTLK